MVNPGAVLDLLPGLARQRPVFHSEADFQHALAWEVHLHHPTWRVRLETRPYQGFHLDLLVSDPADGTSTAVELKYLTALWEGDFAGEFFALKNQGAQDLSTYDCVKDIGRVERLVADGYATSGLTVALTSDPSYWRAPSHGRVTNAAAFRLHEGLVLSGSRAWGPLTGKGTSRGRELSVDLAGQYTTAWRDYSGLPGTRGEFRYLAVVVVPFGTRKRTA